ncbi:MAG: HlyD family efflux transporter periplasmic adaptor subunit [Oscillospiraceae bacterium]|jgi:HlyD family secretion protein|nr:HlyD family efflux transporter periplasmic adaptor subunit [Oscillospiraceae bacterium]
MAEVQTPVVSTPAQGGASAPTPGKASSVKKKQNKRKLRNGIITVVVLAALGVGGYFLYGFLNKTEEVNTEMQTAEANFGMIQSSVQGSGSARAKESAAITLTQSGVVQQLYVNAGDVVTAGQPLYTIFSQAAQDEVASRQADLQKAQEALADLQREMSDLYKQQNNLTVRAPFAGKIVEVSKFTEGLDVSKGAKVCTLVNDRQLKLSLYFSYAYEDTISVGQEVNVSIPAVMGSFTGKVETINKVHYISPEGSDNFEVVVVFNNPGTLTEGMDATASLTAGDGSPIYPYQNGKTEYYEVRDVVTEAGGPMVSQNLLRYADVQEGDTLLVMSSDTIDEELRGYRDRIETGEKAVTNAREALEKSQEALKDFDAVAPIDGTVTSCTLTEGGEVKSGDTVITISNTTTMVVTISVDDRNIAYVKPGMGVDLMSNWGDGGSFYGVVTKIDMSLSGDSMGSGMTNYPVTLEVDNLSGTLLEGMWLSYSFVTSQSDNCIVVPMQSVKYVSLDDGETASVVFIQADSKPENAVDLDIPDLMPGETPTYPSQEDGYYAVTVETGLSDNYNVEIKSGLEGGETIFVNYFVQQAWG